MKNLKLSALALTMFLSLGLLTACSDDYVSPTGNNLTDPFNQQTVSNTQQGQNSTVQPSGSDGLPSSTGTDINNIEWATYSDDFVTLQVPKGWKVTVKDMYQSGDTGSGTSINVEDPTGDIMTDYIDFFTVAAFTMKSATVESFFIDAAAGNDRTITSCVVTSSTQTEEQKQFAAENPNAYLDAKLLTMDVVRNGKTYEGYYSATLINNSSSLTGLYGAISIKDLVAPKGQLSQWQDILLKIQNSIQINQSRYTKGGITTTVVS